MPQKSETHNLRIRENLRMQADSAALSTGAQVYLLGAGIAVPLAGNSAWIASLAAIPAAALLAALARKRAMHTGLSRAGLCLAALSGFLLSAFSSAALVLLAQQALLPQARAIHIAALTAVFITFCAACGRGEVRLCFFMRYALPLILFFSACLQLPPGGLAGVFPILGRGAKPLAAAAGVMAASAAPAAIILLQALSEDSCKEDCYLPRSSFFAVRTALGAAAGCAMLFLLCAGNGSQALLGQRLFGAQLLMLSSGAHQGLFDTAVILSLTAICMLHAARMMLCAADAMRSAFPAIQTGTGLWILPGAALAAVLIAFASLGEAAVPWLGILAAIPAFLSLACIKKERE